jgi:hypothetical protein
MLRNIPYYCGVCSGIFLEYITVVYAPKYSVIYYCGVCSGILRNILLWCMLWNFTEFITVVYADWTHLDPYVNCAAVAKLLELSY